ncbi:CRIB domain-containing protein [Fusarium keratoplasticum]|uniref:CRIB domain-containing protein n=1 Tax=Fusarium keratoplasticum TaxID=1328300 RepID=A0ACC0QTL2_9HYPO|nr:CRIB domain-containing protein [Fusarium keratoplasticum]KAI8666623.1 CRIB domain-containing protein [Fusarium keratoplasticum]
MWASTMPYYSEYQSNRSERDVPQNASARSSTHADADSNMDGSNHSFRDVAPNQQPPVDLNELMGPAIEGPPSPERIRQLSKQMKHASHLHRGHRTVSSGSSSLLASEFDSMSITRRSSQRSTTSGSPSRDRPDSVQVLGKNIFHRRAKSSKSGRSKRESSAHSSSGSSLYSAETGSENSLATFKDSFIPTIFARRKTSRDESALQKKLQISGPFNFQHVTHTPRDQIVSLQRGSRMELMSEMSAMRTADPTSQDLHFRNFSSEHLAEHQNPSPRFQTGPRRLLKHARSQEQLRTSPPPRPVRPPRSPPMEPLHSPTLGPIPPPRVSSRQSTQRDGEPADRPQTSGGFRRPRPFSPDEPLDQPPATSHGYGAARESEELVVDEHRFSHAITTPDDAAWPLGVPGTASYESPLPDVPEEEEHFVHTGRSRVSVTSTRSSLRASQSVPVLRGFQRPMSGASDTLGPLENRKSGHHDGSGADVPSIRESWEDDIDYCYEHEADANFDYEWERPSMDVEPDMAPPVQVAMADDELREVPTIGTAESSPGMLSASRFDMPALSPASQASPPIGHEALTPSSGAVTNNFSFPRGEKGTRPPNLSHSHSRSDSRASSFKESHGFTLSPSLLIPGDYHQQMLLSEAEKHNYTGEDEIVHGMVGSGHSYEDVSNAASHASLNLSHQRASVSTTATSSTTISDSTGERHVSTNSTWTNLTRLTSSTSLSKWAEANDSIPESHLVDPQNDSDEEETTPPAFREKDTVPELTPFPSVPVGKRSLHKSHASESIVRDEVPPMKSAETLKRRPRARTTSLSAQVPPVGQYALFPRAYVKGNNDRI